MRSLRSSASADIRSARAPRRPGGRSELPNGYRVEEAYRHLKTRIMSADLPRGLAERARSGSGGHVPARFRHAVDEHLAIIAALKARDAQAAMEARRRRLESARQSLVLFA